MAEEEKLRDYLRWATTNLHETRERLREVESRNHEPIAIVGLGCRYPGGAQTPDDFWRLLSFGGDAIAGFPADRGWDIEELYEQDPDGTSHVREAGFVQDGAGFDAGFFGISPREALAMDPQQRLLLEVSWEALERAGIDPLSLRGSRTGVFAGASLSGYGFGSGSDEDMDVHLMTGTSTSIISGRVSYVMGLEGPAVTVDTACSSSLVALHLAVQAVRSGECSLALAGGVTVTTTPIMFTQFSRQLGLARDGRCKSFSSSADGMGISEGAGIVVVERLSDALRNGHPVLAIVRGSAINQDGASNGLTAPNGPSQQRVIRAALENARLSVADVDAVEAHGTGTPLGDPIEAQALLATYGQERTDGRALLLGSVKSNIGHTQAAAGVAGIIKMVLALQHGELPPTLHADEPSPHIDWSAGEVALLTERVEWPASERVRRAGVSSFGISGTNAHVILEEPPAAEPVESSGGVEPVVSGAGAGVWLVSGRSAEALSAQAGRLREWVTERPGLEPADVAWSLAATRSVFEHRAVVLGAGRAELVAGLESVAAGVSSGAVVSGVALSDARVGLVFAGQGSQWLGMGRGLYEGSAVFARVFDEVTGLLELELGVSVRDVVLGAQDADESLVNQTLYAQTGLFAFEVALAEVLRGVGVVADAVVGHSVGEVVAAYVAGVLSLPDACRLVAARARLMQGLPSGGAMAAVNVSEADVTASMAGVEGVSIAAVNGPDSVVVSGDADAVAQVAEYWREQGRRVRELRVSHAFHSPAMDPVTGELGRVASELEYRRPQVLWAGALSGELVSECEPGYWPAQARQAVRFADALGTLAAQGINLFIEVGPDGSLSPLGADAVAQVGVEEAVFVPLQRRTDEGVTGFVTGLARAFVHGASVDWTAVLPTASRVELPTYAFRHERYWVQGTLAVATATHTSPLGRDGAGTAAEGRFWTAVEGGDLAYITTALAIDGTRPFSEILPALAAWRRLEQDRSVTAGWRYRAVWAPVAEPDARVLSGTWLVAAPASAEPAAIELRRSCVAALEARGAEVVVVEVGTTERAELAALISAEVSDVAGVLSLLALDETPLSGHPSVTGGLAGTLALVQALGDAGLETAPLWVATRGAVAAGAGEVLTAPVQAQVWGLGRVVAMEYPDRWGGLVDLPEVVDERAGARLASVLAGCGEGEVAIRAAGVLGRRLVHAARPRETETPWSPRGTTLITGGTGAIAGHVARWLAGRGASRLVLTSRSGPSAQGAAVLAAELAEAGSAVDIVACDVSDRVALAGLLESTGPELSAVMHTAGVLDDGVVDRLSAARLESVLAAKAVSAALLDELTEGLDLDAFVLFSSSSATLGAAGQGNYAAANAYLDALAENRRSRGLAGLSVAWGAWAGAGLAGASEAARHRTAQGPMPAMDPRLAVRALGEALDGSDPALTVMDVDWGQLATAPGAAGITDLPLVRDLPEIRQLAVTGPSTATVLRGDGELARRLAGLSRAEQDRTLTEIVRGEAARVLGYPSADAVEAGRAFTDLGFDSLTAVELRNGINAATGLRLSSTLVFDYPTPSVLAAHLRSELAGELTAGTAAPVATAVRIDPGEPLAIVGMACRYPGGVMSPEAFWELLASGGDAVGGVPQDRGWDLEALFDPDPDQVGTSYTRQGGFLTGAGDFDAGFFGISPREATATDPQQRLLLEVAWEALERSGIDPLSLRGSATGVFAGGYGSGYGMTVALTGDGASGLEGHLMTGNATSVLSGRVSYALGLEGPAVTVDTACSSSLVALHFAAQAVRSGECSLALVGGVTIMATPWEMVGFSRQRGLAEDGRCKAFSADADGMGMAEGAGMLVVERLSDAQRNGHRVLAVVRGSAVNQDGASNGLTAPNGPSQQRVIRAALASAQLSSADVDVVEAHGTGTTLGDPIEAQALLATYGQERVDGRALLLGSVKSNIGHTQAAAGVAGIIKMVLALQHERLPRTLHADEPSPHVDWSAGEVSLLTESVGWPAGERPRRAGVSSFGISGTNAHVIIEEAPDAEPVESSGEVEPVVSSAGAWLVSGRTAAGLSAQAGRLREWVTARPGLEPADVAWSLAATRSVFEHRAVVLGGGRAELVAGLESVAAGVSSGAVVSGVARSDARVGLVFAGQGSQWLGMGRGLYEGSAVFARVFDQVSGLLELELGVSVRDVVLGAQDADESLVNQTLYAQTGLFAFEVALAELLAASGLAADAVVGHSVGEVVAAYVAGVLSLPDACRLVAARARLMQGLPSGGAMAAVNVSEADVVASMAGVAGVSIAAVNGPDSVVVSGDADAVAQVVEYWRGQGRRVRELRVSHAFHSPAMDPVMGELGRVASELEYRRPQVLWAGALSGELVSECEPGYWPAQTRQAVRFADALGTLAAQGINLFIEVGPDGSLSALGADAGEEAVFVPLQRRTDEGVTGFVTGLARAFVHGASVDWRAVLPTAQCVELPTYAFRHERFWPEGEMRLPTGTVSGAGLAGGAVGAEAEALFWAAVEGGDMGRLAETLAVDGGLPFREVLPALASWRRREADRSVTAGWRYRASWVPVVEPDARVVSGTWLVAAPASAEPAAIELRRSCVAALEARGASTVVVEVPAGLVERAELAALIGADVSDVAGVLSLLALDEAPLPGGSVVAGGLAATLALVQGLGDAGVAAPLWVATRGAVAAGAGEVLTAPVQAQVWGLGRVVAMEHPDRWGGLIDLPEVVDERAGARLASVLAGCGEGEVAIRAAGVLGRRLAHAPQPRETETPWTPRGTTLITGGTGAIAGHVARWLAGRGASRLVLTSRSGPAAQGAAVLAAELAEAGSAVDVVACDVSDRVAVAGLLESTGPDLSAVMHTAGVLDDGVVDRLSAERLEPVLTAKATSAAYLDELTADLDLDAFVLFSSAAATLGAAGQGNYAAANAYLDALAESRRSRGLAGLSVAWGAWAGGGFAASSDVVRARVRRGAMPAMDPSLAVRALGEALEGSDPALTVMDVDWAQLASSSEAAHIRELPLVRDLPEIRSLVAAGSASGAVVDEGELVGRLRGLGRAEEQTRVLAEVVRTEAAAVLGHASAEAVQDRQNFKDLGFDSLTSVELRNRLASVTGLRLPATLVFDYPTPVALAGFLRGELTGDLESVAPVVVAAGVSDEPLAIVGMACRFPGGVASPEAFWELLASGGDAVGGFPTDRGWDLDSVYDPDRGSDGTSYTRSGAFLREAAQFDAGFFGISPREALAMDPQQRLLLEASWEALERAGIDAGSLRGSATGVFAGGFASGYGIGIALSGQSGSGVEGHLMTGNATSVLSGRVSYVMGLEGPAVTVDTACSSSLVALHLAAQALRSGECSLALAGGVTVMATPATFIDFSRQQGLSVDGRCRAFSADADGTGWAEGAGMLVVERLSDAQRNGHPILAIVRGSAVNQDGASNGLTAPNGPSQQRVIRAALASAQLSPADVDVVEAHGTGTKLGDPIEAQALLATYGQERTDGRALLLGSVKSNIGHTQAAAGVAGIIKIVLALQHGELPPTLHADEPSPHVDWSAGEVSLLTESVGWPAGERPRRAGVSSFGMSGTNAHVIIEEAPDAEPVESSGGVEPVVSGAGAWLVSGRTAAGLSAQAGRLREWVTERPGLEPADVAWSLAATRSVFEHRAVVLGADRAELVAGLESVAAGVSSGAVVSGVARSDARVGLVFAGQGSQWLGMGRGLYEGSAVFARVFDEVTGLLELELGVSVRDVVLGAEGVDEGLVNQTLYAQTGLFAFEVALAEVLRGVGVVADAVVGHSVGELVAAYVAGVLSLPDACRLVAARARLMQGLPSGGAMAAVNASEADVTASMAGVASVSIAAVNGPDSMVVSGDADAVAQVAEYWREQGRRVRELRVSHAFHSPAMDPVTGELGRVASELEYHRPDVLWAGALSGELVSECEPGYWPAQARQAVRFADALGTLAAQGINLFIEVGPDGSLSALGRDAVAQVGVEEAVFVPLQRRTDEGVTGFVTGLARAFVHGASVDWTAVLPTASRVELPTYAFRHERFWPEGELRLPLGGAADGEQRGGIEAEARFWAAVEEGDLSRLAESLAGGDDRPIGEVLPALASWRRREADRSVTAGWRYRASWVPVVEPDARVVSGTWLVAAPASAEPAAVELRRSCVAALEARGAEVVVVEVGTTERAELAALIGAEVSDVAGVLSLLALDEAPLPGGSVVAGGLAATLALVQGLGDAGVAAPLWVATRGAVAAGAGEVLTAPVQAQVWGLGRVVGLEHPDRWGGLIDLPEVVDERAGARLASVLAGCGEGEVAIRAAGVLGRRLAHAPQPRETETPWTPRGTTLITGGTGAIAGHVARWLADRRAPRLVLSSRSGPSAFGAGALAAELAQAGSAVDIVACDVSDRVAVAGLLESTGPDLSAVMHTAGVLDDGVVDRLSAERLEPVLTAKATSAAYLDELTADLDLDAFVLFSSAAATLGAAGQGNYAAANAYLDALAESRRSRGLAGLSVAWGAWAGGGFAASSDVVRARVRRGAMPAMDPSLAVRALGEALEGSDPALTVMDVDWAQLASSSEAAHIRELPLVRDLPEIRQAARAASAVGAAEPTEGELVKRLAGLSREEQERALTEVVRIEAAAVLGHASTDAVSDRQNFKDLGFDSLTSVELRNRLASVTGRRLPSTLVFDYPNPAALAAYLRGELTGDLGSAAPVVVAAGVSDEPLAIVGMACRFPGGVASPEAFWELLASGGDAVGGFPTDRGWDLDSVYDPDGGSDGTSYTRSGAFLREAAQFDAGFFGVSPREALAMDPQQRLLLEASWEAFERAGIDPGSLRGSATGVFAGGFSSSYNIGVALSEQGTAGVEGHLMTGNATSVLSGRVSYVMGLEGPAVTIDTACSSSLVALHLAGQALRSGECSLALAGGVTVMATPATFIDFSRQQGLSVDGRCRAFSADADGTGWAEGAGMLVVERLSDARRNGHPVLAVLRGSAVNQDGASNGLTAPNGPSQQRVIRAALASAQLSPADVDVVEAHGTGTKLGDPIEAQALLATYGQDRPEGLPVWLGSVKSNIGHTQAAAGVAGLIKMVLALQHEQLPPTLHAEVASPHVDWSAGEVSLLTESVGWPAGERPRRAGVSSFGMSGTNAHVIIEEAPDAEPVESSGGVEPVVSGAGAWLVSGRTAAGLSAQAGRLREWVTERPGLEPADVAWSLAATRSVFEHRAVVLGGGRAELVAGLESVAAGVSSGAVVSGVARSDARVGLVFAGQGSQWLGMGRGLYEGSAVFARVFDQVSGLLELELGVSVRDVVLGAQDADESLVNQTLYAQTGLFAFEVALAELLAASGLAADAVVGHSVGEVVAAYVAGVLSLPDACRLVAARARLMQGLPSGGAMAAVNASEADVTASMAGVAGVSIAAVNGPDSVVVSGDADAVAQVVEYWREQGRRVRELRVSHAFHSPAMDPVTGELGRVASELEYHRPQVLWAGALSGELVSECEPGYWPAQTRQAVRFADALGTLAAQGINLFIEVGPDGSLSALGADAGEEAVFVPLQRRTDEGVTGFVTGLARAFVHGASVDWAAVLPTASRVELPTYAFRHERFWPEGEMRLPTGTVSGAGLAGGAEVDARFWAAVEGGDLGRLAETLAVDGGLPFREVLPALASWRRREADRSVTAGWRYRAVWAPVAEPDARVLSGTWLVVVPAEPAAVGLRRSCVAALEARGAETVVVEVGTTERAELAALISAEVSDVAGVLSLLALDETPLSGHPSVTGGLAGTLALVQALGDVGVVAPLWVATRGAVAAGAGEVLTAPVQAQVWGLGRVVGLEHPDRWGGLVDLPEVVDERAGARLASVLAGCGEGEVAIRAAGVLGRRLAHAPRPRETETPWTPRGTTLITGGTGAIAGHVARWLADRRAPRLVLTSRSGPSAFGAGALAAELAEAGSAVDIVACDVSDRVALAGLLESTGPELSAVMHTAGVLDDGVVDRLSVERLESVLTAKATSATYLDELTADLDLDAFVLFSSAAATLGAAGQGNYAAANAYLDALAENRRSRGLAGLSVAWGAWAGGGFAASSDVVRARVRRGAMPAMDPSLTVRALGEALEGSDPALTVMDVDWAQLASGSGAAGIHALPLVRDLPEIRSLVAAGSASGAVVDEGELVGRLRGLGRAEEQTRVLAEVVRTEAAAVLGHASAEAVQDRQNFKDLGFDSLTSVELRNRLSTATGLRLPSTLVFDYPTPVALAAWLRAELLQDYVAEVPVLAELDRLEAALLGGPKDESVWEQAADRLRKLLDTVDSAVPSRQRREAELESATDDELFTLVDELD